MKQGDIYLARLEPVEGTEQGGTRPVVIISGESMNTYFDVVICCPITSHIKNYAGCVQLKSSTINGLDQDSEIITFKVRAISKNRLGKRLGNITQGELEATLSGLDDVLRY